MGGLLTAAILSKEGYQVTVLEKNKQIGGALQSYALDGKLFETAVHYIGSMNPHETLYRLFDYVGVADELQLRKLDEDCYDEIIIGEQSYKLAQHYNQFIETLCEYFPDEVVGIQQFVYEIKNVCGHFPLYNLRLGNESEKQKVIHDSVAQKLQTCIKNSTLQQVLTGNHMLYAGNNQITPFYQYALIQNSYIESSWKFTKGSIQLAKQLQHVIQSYGGRVIRNVDVQSIIEQNGKIQYVTDQHGEQYAAQQFISGLHPLQTYRLIQSKLIKPATIKRIQQIPQTLSCFMVNISLHSSTIVYKNHNTYIHTGKHIYQDLQTTQLFNPTSFGVFYYEDELHRGFASAISILCYMHADQVPEAKTSYRTTSVRESRGEAYENWKYTKAMQIISYVTPYFPDLAKAVKKIDACSPLTYRDYLNMPQGAMYGLQKNVQYPERTTFSTRTKIENLFLTGQNINLHGILGSSITSILTAAACGIGLENLVNKINNHKRTSTHETC